MARKSCPDEFERDVVVLYRDAEGATIIQIAAELGVGEATLSVWWWVAGVVIRYCRSASAAAASPGAEFSEHELAWLRAENMALRADKTRLSAERDILRSAGKYFAGEANW